MSHRSALPGLVLLLAFSSACGEAAAPAPLGGGGAVEPQAGSGPAGGATAGSSASGAASGLGGAGQAPGGTGGSAGSESTLGGGGAASGGSAGTGGATTTPSLIPDPAAGGWQLNEYSMIVEGALELTPGRADTDGHERGTAFWPTALESAGLHIEFDVDLTPRQDHGDGMTLAFADPAAGAKATDFGDSGGGLGYAAAPCCLGIKGVAVALDTSKNANDPAANFLGVATGGQIDKITWAVTETEGIPTWVGTPHHLVVRIAAGALTIAVDGNEVLKTALGSPSIPAQILLGFTAANGSGKSRQLVKNVVVSRD